MEPSEKNASVSSVQFVEDPIGTHCQVSGKGMPLLLLHDFTGPEHCWAGLIEILSEYGSIYQMILPGFLKKDSPDLISSQNYQRFITESYDYFQLRKPFLVGFGTGCLPILEYASQYSERISGIVLINPVFVNRSGYRLFPKRVSSRILDAYHRLLNQNSQIQKNDSLPDLKELLNNNRIHSVIHNSLLHNLDQIKAPVLLIAGDSNPLMSLKNIHDLEGHLQSVELIIVKDGKHFYDSETMRVLSDIMIKFIKIHYSDTIHKTVF